MKIAGFSMTKDVYDENYFVIKRLSLLPVRWMAPESLDAQKGYRFDSRSDVVCAITFTMRILATYASLHVFYMYLIINNRYLQWSFGVTFWEIMSRGRKPYSGVKHDKILEFLQDGVRLEKPACCWDAV